MDSVKTPGTARGDRRRRPYRMKRRTEAVGATRRRITEAAVRLHTSVGPSRASMSAVADEAGVTRVTLYRHFASADELFGACMAHWRAQHPPPDVDRWRTIGSFARRVETGIGELYAWYSANGDELYPIYRDAEHTPASNRQARAANNARLVDALLEASTAKGPERRRLRAALGHVVGFWTWRSLAVDQGLSTREATAMAVGFVVPRRTWG